MMYESKLLLKLPLIVTSNIGKDDMLKVWQGKPNVKEAKMKNNCYDKAATFILVSLFSLTSSLDKQTNKVSTQ